MHLDHTILMPKLASYAERFRREFIYADASALAGRRVVSRDGFTEVIKDPCGSARVFFKFYAFARAGGQEIGYEDICTKLLERGLWWESGDEFHRAYVKECRKRHREPNPRNEQLVSRGYAYHLESETGWLHRLGSQIDESTGLTDAYLQLISISGIGFKIAALACRDLAWAFDQEAKVPILQRPLLQPIDRWLWRICYHLWPEYRDRAKNDDPNGGFQLLSALRFAEAAEALGISNVAFNQGAWYFCRVVVGKKDLLDKILADLQNRTD